MVAGVCLVFVAVSLIVERAIHFVGQWLLRRKKKPLYDALEKMKGSIWSIGSRDHLMCTCLCGAGVSSLSKVCRSSTGCCGPADGKNCADVSGESSPSPHLYLHHGCCAYILQLHDKDSWTDAGPKLGKLGEDGS
ncbi:hypothetical protein Mapa_013340 [Marchantia paleacea]|nr:hypothetical protein Mapa_013340 [Marchantia paleacea]